VKGDRYTDLSLALGTYLGLNGSTRESLISRPVHGPLRPPDPRWDDPAALRCTAGSDEQKRGRRGATLEEPFSPTPEQ